MMIRIVFIISLLLPQAALSEVTSVRQAELLYFLKHDCGSCHGLTLKGGLGPSLQAHALEDKPKELLVITILEGRENTAMPPWKSMLSREDATWLAEQLKLGTTSQTEIAVGNQ